jgi:zinc/manganese transport system substrate-binding protein/zinc transport system substrate-binding protein
MRTVAVLLVCICLCGILVCCPQAVATRPIKVVATTTDLADLAKVVGGDRVTATSIGRGNQDVHLIDPRPSHVAMLRDADVFVKIGMDLDKWSEALVDASRNRAIRYGGPGYVDCSVRIHRLDVPRGKVDPSKGEWHAYGNPHYWLDPLNAEIISANILEGLKRVAPRDADYFEKNRNAFLADLRAAMQRWQEKLAPYKGRKIVTYHRAWTYFVRRFGIDVLGCIEPKPGIPPTASHVASLIERIRAEKEPVVIADAAFYPDKAATTIAARTGAKFVVIPSSVGGVKGAGDFFSLFDHIVDGLVKGFSG